VSDRYVAWADRNGPALVAVAIAAASLAYLADAVGASTRLHNLILLVPLVGFVVVMTIGIVIAHWWRGPDATTAAEDDERPEGSVPISPLSIAAMMAALLLYAFTAPTLGFDLASALFIGFCLYVQGERRWWFLVLFSVFFSAAITWSLAHIAGAAVPTLLI
jgi:putative tricarboxylic transport membrane protein